MDAETIICPVCTLYLRPGITLKSHLSSHPKQKVIEALVRLSNLEEPANKLTAQQLQLDNKNVCTAPSTSNWCPPTPPSPTANFGPVPPGNHSFIYQQFMSTSSPQTNVLNVNPLTQQYVTIPTVFSPPMMCPPYVYHQQQQVIMSSGSNMLPRNLPIEMPPAVITISDVDDELIEEKDDEQKSELDDGDVTEKIEEEEQEEEELPKALEENEIDIVKDNEIEEDCNSSPRSDWSVRVRTDLSKACQTFANSTSFSSAPASPQTDPECSDETLYVQNENQTEFYYSQNSQQQQNETATTSTTTTSEQQINFVDVEEMQIMLASGDFMGGQLISQVENFENASNSQSQSGVLMTLGGVGGGNEFGDERVEESASRESAIANIRADERMPARGELSGQESNGGIGITVFFISLRSSIYYDIFYGICIFKNKYAE